MKSIVRRIQKLDERFMLETESSRRLRARLEAGRRRLAKLRGETAPDEVAPPASTPPQRTASDRSEFQSIADRLIRGRDRLRALRESAQNGNAQVDHED
jgi:hypothetical protein